MRRGEGTPHGASHRPARPRSYPAMVRIFRAASACTSSRSQLIQGCAVPQAVPAVTAHPADRPPPADHDRRPDPHARPGRGALLPHAGPAGECVRERAGPVRQIVYDDSCTARELEANEELFLEMVCNPPGHDLESVDG
jgi:hypothetical protein